MLERQVLSEFNLNALAERIYKNAKKHGFHKKGENIPEKLMLIVSEVGEACEALRRGKRFGGKFDVGKVKELISAFKGDLPDEIFEAAVKDTFEDEIADAIIRLLDLAHSVGMDVDFHVREKMKYNESRPFRHGKLF
jgi:NTP pyrophosphatase (non-canonical NTP hydrolase)